MTSQAEPNVDALAQVIRAFVTSVGSDYDPLPYGVTPRLQTLDALTELAALARSNTARDQLLHDAMDELAKDPFVRDGWRVERSDRINALLARFRALTGTDT